MNVFSNKRPMDRAIIEWQSNFFKESLWKLCEFKDDWRENWRVISDVINMSETYVTHNNGVWRERPKKKLTLEDKDGIIQEAINIFAKIGVCASREETPEITEEDKEVIDAVIDCYIEIIGLVSAEDAQKCKNITQDRIRKILRGKSRDHDIII